MSQTAYPRRTVNFIKIQNQLQPAFGVGFGKCSHVKVDRAILHYKGLFTRIILGKSAFNYCQGTPKYENVGISQTIALYPYPTLEKYHNFFKAFSNIR